MEQKALVEKLKAAESAEKVVEILLNIVKLYA